MERIGECFIGTSGWKYAHWDKVFYPSSLKKKDQLDYFTSRFKTVELNNSFYREPTVENFLKWKNAVPPDFVYSVKANRYFTHLKKLKVSREELDAFLMKVVHLEDKLGAVLFQLPPSWKINIERFALFLSLLPHGIRFVFEFRNPTWYDEPIYSLLKEYNCSFCIYELAGHISPIEVTADFVYVRLHGPGDKYDGSYPLTVLQKWAEKCEVWRRDGKDVFIYFDNDMHGYAPFNAIDLKKLLNQEL